MGSAVSVRPPPPEVSKYTEAENPRSVVFKVFPSEDEARRKFESDGTLLKNSDLGHLALRTMLDEPLSQNALGKFAAKIQVLDIFMCWIDIKEYKTIPTESYRRSKALHIFQKYIRDEASMMIGVTTLQERNQIEELIRDSRTNPSILTSTFYDSIQSRCFVAMYHNIYLPFRQTDEFTMLQFQLRSKYNTVKLSDFDYYSKLGEGGFGFVVHCRKKSTGRHYAMKIQTKQGLLDSFKDDPYKANLEKEAFQTLQHPFIVNLYYAFQTPSLAIMVLDLADAGDLHTVLTTFPQKRLPEDRVRFYMAEIILALGYLHQRGLIYRDLKPQNVLLNSDGHVQLVDLGGIMDDQGEWTEKQMKYYRQVLPLFSAGLIDTTSSFSENSGMLTPVIENENSTSKLNDDLRMTRDENDHPMSPSASPDGKAPHHAHHPSGQHHPDDAKPKAAGDESKPLDAKSVDPAAPKPPAPEAVKKIRAKRKQSIMGTLGYMAPEMVLLLSRPPMYGENQNKQATRELIKRGYSNAVDWWSLGVTIYKLLTGQRPFGDRQMHAIVEMVSTLHQAVGENMHFREYAMLFQKVNFPSNISPAGQDLITRLLDVNDKTRLGAGINGILDLKRHEFFAGIDWDALEQKQIIPPYQPYGIDYEEGFTPVPDLRTLLREYGKESYLDEPIADEQQKYFLHWDFISPHTLRVEAGLSHMMEQLGTNMKARKLIGPMEDMEGRKPEKIDALSTKLFGKLS